MFVYIHSILPREDNVLPSVLDRQQMATEVFFCFSWGRVCPTRKAQRQAREERLVRVGSTDANVPGQHGVSAETTLSNDGTSSECREPKDRNLQAYLEKASEIGPGRRYPWPWRGVLRLTAETRKQTWPITLSRPQRIVGPSDQLKV